MGLQMIGSSGVIAAILLVDMSALLLYNVSGMCVTGEPRIPQPVARPVRCYVPE